jgi:hypothetical protein
MAAAASVPLVWVMCPTLPNGGVVANRALAANHPAEPFAEGDEVLLARPRQPFRRISPRVLALGHVADSDRRECLGVAEPSAVEHHLPEGRQV